MKKIRFSKTQKITMIALVGMGLYNPFTVAVLDEWFKLVYTGIFVACVVWVCSYLLYKVLKPETVKIPAKGAKVQKAGKFIE